MKKVKEKEHIDSAKEFLTALDAIVKEKGIDKGQVLEAMELALASAYKKHTGKANGKAKVNPITGEILTFVSGEAAAKHFGVRSSAVTRWINGTRKPTNGYKFEYIESSNND